MDHKRIIQNEAISASAGTGKTYALAVRYIRLLASGASPESIAAMTFTRKAAGEILDRIISILCDWIKDPVAFEKQKSINDFSGLEHNELFRILYELLMKIHKIQISTLDSFYVNIIQAFPFEFGLNGDFQIVDTSDEEEAKLTVLKEILWHEADEKEKTNFLNEFKDATYGNEEKSILMNMKNFIDEHHDAFMQTQQENKWGNMDVICGDYKKHLEKKVKLEDECRVLQLQLQKMDLSDKQRLMWQAFMDESISLIQPYRYASKEANDTYEKILKSLTDIRNGTASFPLGGKRNEYEQNICCILDTIMTSIIGKVIMMQQQRTRGMYQVLNRYEQTYDKLVRRSGMFTFQDVLHQLSLSLFDENFPILSSEKGGGVDRVYIDYRLDSRYDHWLLDEFQDTSNLQWKVIENLIDEVMQDTSGLRSFFYVGDIKQSIYQWRSGDPRLFNLVYNRFSHFGSEIKKSTLQNSYRSNSEITDTVNKVFAGISNKEILTEEIPQDVFDRMEWKKHESIHGPGGFAGLIGMDVIKGANDDDALARKAQIIADRIKEIKPFEKNWSVAILLRQGKHTATFAKVLKDNGIKATSSSEVGICDNPIVSAFLSLITLAEHPQDEFAWNHLRMTPFADEIFVRDTVSIELLDDIFNQGYKYLIEKWIGTLAEKPEIIDEKTRNELQYLINAAEMFDAGPLSSPHDFIDFIENYKVKFTSFGGTVQIMTIHKAKGLGFDLVFLPFNDKGTNRMRLSKVDGLQVKKDVNLTPEWAFMMPKKDIAKSIPNLAEFIEQKDKDQCYENLCLLYVAITRAAKGLYMLVDKQDKPKSIKASTLLLATLTEGYEADSELPGIKDASWLYTSGKASWYASVERKTKDEGRKAEGKERKLKINFSGALKKRTPSGSEPYITFGENLFSGATSGAMNLGTAVHELFEYLGWANIDDYDEVIKAWQNEIEYPTQMQQTATDMFISALNSPEIFEALSRPSPDSELWREQDFSVVIDGEWVSGSFDRVVINKTADGKATDAIIMDYKTDQVENDEGIQAKVEIYSSQLQVYSKVLAFILKIAPTKISTKLLFVRLGKVALVNFH